MPQSYHIFKAKSSVFLMVDHTLLQEPGLYMPEVFIILLGVMDLEVYHGLYLLECREEFPPPM